MPVQKDIEEGIFRTTVSSNEENNDTASGIINTTNNNEVSTQSPILSSPTGTTSTLNDVSHTLTPPQEDTNQSTLFANLNTSYGHNETEQQGYTIPNLNQLLV